MAKITDIDGAIDQLLDFIDFDTLIIWADALEVEHDEESWLDDMWPDAQAEIEREVGEALLKAIEFDARPLFAACKQLKESNNCLLLLVDTDLLRPDMKENLRQQISNNNDAIALTKPPDTD
jgi:hypothetical protein